MKFYGRVGYGETVEKTIDETIDEELVHTPTGVFEEQITEYEYFGDVIRNARNLSEGENLHDDLSVQNSISIMADAYANEHFHSIRYVEWAGTLWTVSSVEVESPRLILRLGEVYHGPTPTVTPDP